jgi:hypothetical protein
MRNLFTSMLVLVVLFALLPGARGGEKTSFEDVVKQMLETMDSLTTTLATIRDEETARAAHPELRKTAGNWQVIKKKAEGLPPPSKEEKDRLSMQYKTKLEEAQKKMFGEVGRVGAIPGGREALLEISALLGKKSKK